MTTSHPHSPSSLSSPSDTLLDSPAHDPVEPPSPSDSDLSDLEAEIEKDLSSASPVNGTKDSSDDDMDIDSEDEKPSKNKKRNNAKEYYDPELYGLRRSVSTPDGETNEGTNTD
jgi:hypothetical protein